MPTPGAAWASDDGRAAGDAARGVEERTERGYDAITRRRAQAATLCARRRRHRRRAGDPPGACAKTIAWGSAGRRRWRRLLAMLDAQLDAARRLRLARDSWAARVDVWRALPERHRRAARDHARVARGLDRSAGSRVRRASRAQAAVVADATRASTLLAGGAVPAEAAEAHDLLRNASRWPRARPTARLQAIASGNMKQAWDASSAAPGALMLFDRAADELRQLHRAEGAPLIVITPRTTRLIRAADLRAFQHAIVERAARRAGRGARLRRDRAVAERGGRAAPDDRESAPSAAGAATRRCPISSPATSSTSALRERLPGAPAALSPFDREVLLRRRRAPRTSPAPSRRSTCARASSREILALYDELRRHHRDRRRLRSPDDRHAASRRVDIDRGAARLLAQTVFLTATFEEFERQLAGVAGGRAPDPRAGAGVGRAALSRRLIVTVADQAADRARPVDGGLRSAARGCPGSRRSTSSRPRRCSTPAITSACTTTCCPASRTRGWRRRRRRCRCCVVPDADPQTPALRDGAAVRLPRSRRGARRVRARG